MFKFGIIGAGNIANRFCDAVNMIETASVVAVASKTLEKAKTFAKDNKIDAYYDSYDELVKRDDIDAIYIATTHNFHYDNCMLALSNGKHVLCEKALTLTKAQTEEIFNFAKSKNLFCMEAMWSRFLPAVKKAKDWIDSGKVGEIDMSTFLVGFKCDDNPLGRMRNPNLAGGAIFDIGVYAIEMTTYLINQELKNVQSVITYTNEGVDKVDSITLSFDNCVSNLQCIITCNVDSEMNIYGTHGRINIKNPLFADKATLYDSNGIVLEEFYARRDNGFEYEIQEVIDCVKAGKLESDVIPHKDTIQCAEIFDLCLKK
ncbi:MAG: Gfo/Idh/MocA family oxidoreductase [Oscillospiraceae bacterium]